MFILYSNIKMVYFTYSLNLFHFFPRPTDTVKSVQGERWQSNQLFPAGLRLTLLNWAVLKWSSPQDDASRTPRLPPVLNTLWERLSSPRIQKMTSPVTKAMIESYALMVMVMGTFFVYFCGMVWAFCNPKLSGAEEECVAGKQAVEHGDDRSLCAPNPPERHFRCACAQVPAPPYTAQGLTQTTYVNFWDDTDSLLADCNAFCREDLGINNQIGSSRSWIS